MIAAFLLLFEEANSCQLAKSAHVGCLDNCNAKASVKTASNKKTEPVLFKVKKVGVVKLSPQIFAQVPLFASDAKYHRC